MIRLFFLLLICLAPLSAVGSGACRPGGVTCTAYWTGYEFDPVTRTCEAYSASGCSNPFSYGTREDCNAAHPDGNHLSCMIYWYGWEFDANEGTCKRVGATGCRDPFRYQSQQDCERFHPKCDE